MDFAAIVAGHRLKALERIAETERMVPSSQNVATLDAAPPIASIDKILTHLSTTSAQAQSPQVSSLPSLNTDKQTHPIEDGFPVPTAGQKRRSSSTNLLEAPFFKTLKSEPAVSQGSPKLRFAAVPPRVSGLDFRASTDASHSLEDTEPSACVSETENDPINLDLYETLTNTGCQTETPSAVSRKELSAVRAVLAPLNINNNPTSLARDSYFGDPVLIHKRFVGQNLSNVQAAQTSVQVKQEFGKTAWNFISSQKQATLEFCTVDKPEDEPNTEGMPDVEDEPNTEDMPDAEDEPDAETLKLLSYVSSTDGVVFGHEQSIDQAQLAEFKTTPLFSRAVSAFLDASRPVGSFSSSTFPQYGLLGMYESIGMEQVQDGMAHDKIAKASKDRLLFANMNAPWSAFICGSQGAGKSHTLSCLLETGLVQHSDLNKLPNPLSSIVFHYDKFSGKSSTQLCEAAFLCSSGRIPVTVLVPPSNVWNLKEMYTNLPGLPATSPRPQVKPLYLSERHLTAATMMKLMFTDTREEVPLYVAVVHTILQEMAMQGKGAGNFLYTDFKNRIEQHNWLKGQKGPLEMRLKLLESFLEPSGFTRTTRPAPSKEDIWTFKPGTLTIVDLSDSFISENDACALFSICLTIFMESRNKAGQIICLDEAHKFLTQSGEAKALTEALTSIIRQQRHTGTRVIIATQEPTLSPVLMDLTNVTIVHRFLSPAWYETIKRHLAGANKHDGTNFNSLFETIVNLSTGEALLFCPTALLTVSDTAQNKAVTRLGNDYARIRIRKRHGTDGGRSVMASDTSTDAAASITVDVPMFVVTRPPTPPRQFGGPPRRIENRPHGPAGQAHNNQPVLPQKPQFKPTPIPPSKPITAPVVVQSSSLVANPPAAPALGQVNYQHLQQAVNHYISQQFNHGWQSPGCVSWPSVYKRVEEVCMLRGGTIANSSLYRDFCTRTGTDQINVCRDARGMYRI